MRRVALLIVVLVVLTTCGGDSDPMSLAGYVSAMQEVEDDFAAETSSLDGTSPSEEYYIDGELVGATHLYELLQERLAGWRAIAPPADVAEHHDELIEALTDLQDEVGMYLLDEALTAEEFEFASIGTHPAIVQRLEAAEAACRDLRSQVTTLGTSLTMATDCEF